MYSYFNIYYITYVDILSESITFFVMQCIQEIVDNKNFNRLSKLKFSCFLILNITNIFYIIVFTSNLWYTYDIK